MPTVEQYREALIKADRAGDKKAAELFASKIKGLQSKPVEEPSIGSTIGSGLETAATIATGAIAEPIAGLRGIYEQVTGGDPVKAIEETREGLTYRGGKDSQKQLQAIGETLKPVGEALSSAEMFMGESVLDKTGSPALAAIAHTLPTAALELLGFKGSKRLTGVPTTPTKRQIQKSIVESSPQVESIKNASRAVYNEIDQSGVTVKKSAVDGLINRMESKAKKAGLDPRLTDKSARAMSVIRESKGVNQPLTELDSLRSISQRVANSLDDTEKSLGNLMLSEIDDFMDNIKPSDLIGGTESKAVIGKKYKTARKLWGRAKRSELINEAIKRGEDVAAGPEAGIRNELNRILRNKKLSKYLPESDKEILRDVVQGDFKQNFTRAVGKLGISIDRSPNIIGSIIGGAGGGSIISGVGSSITAPALAVVGTGTVAKEIAKRLTRNKAKFADSMVRAGKDANKIAKAYLTSVPKNKRNVKDLADLLSDPEINLDDLEMIANKTFQDAVDVAKGRRAINLAAAALSGQALNNTEQE